MLFLNSRIPFPMDAPISGSRLAPKTSSTTSRMIMISVKPRLPIGPSRGPREERLGDQVRQRHTNETHERQLEAHRTDSEVYNQEIDRSEEHTSELQSRLHLVCRLLLEKKKKK